MNRFTVAVFLFFFMGLSVFGQESDTIYNVQSYDTIYEASSDSIFQLGEGEFFVADTVEVEVRVPKDPTKALMYALVLPGLGQAYNGKYWKMPIVWGAFGVAGYAIVFNTNGYKEAINNYNLEASDDNERWIQLWKRNMELSYIAAIFIYGLQILDAYVDANMYTWNVNDNLSLRISPSIQPMMTPASLNGLSGGLTCSFKIKGR
jgi:hypothetical protein